MARQRFPSDEKRLRAPAHVRIDLGFRRHPRTSGLSLEQRAIVWSLWYVAREARSGGDVAIARDDLSWITGRQDQRHAQRAFLAVCELMDYAVRARCVHGERAVRTLGARSEHAGSARCAHSECAGTVLLVNVRNYEQKQGFRSAIPPSDVLSESDDLTETERETSTAESLSDSGGFERKNGEATEAPERLVAADLANGRAFCRKSRPELVRDLDLLAEKFLSLARSRGSRLVDWGEGFRVFLANERVPQSGASAARPGSSITDADRHASREIPLR